MEFLGDCGPPLRTFGRCSESPVIHDVAQTSSGPIAEEELLRVHGARVVCANYRALLHDFPHIFGAEARRRHPLPGCDTCAEAGKLCIRAVNGWLIRNSAFISRQQSLSNEVNSLIHVDPGEVRRAYRPPEYGRAAIVPIDSETRPGEARYLDLKGVGVAAGRLPSHQPHSSGLEYVGNALVDFFLGWLVDTIFARTCPGYRVVPVYAVLDLGFDILGGAFGTSPAGLQVRRAHSRPFPLMPLSGSAHEKLMIHVEMMLRLFGLTTANYLTSYRLRESEAGPELVCCGRPLAVETEAEKRKAARLIEVIRDSAGNSLDVLNVQLTNEGDWERKALEIFDFGHVRAERRFSSPLANPLRDGALRIGRITTADERSFVQPDPRIAIDADLCDREAANAFGFYTAAQFRYVPRLCTQHRVETILRLARMKVMRRDMEWARRKVEAA